MHGCPTVNMDCDLLLSPGGALGSIELCPRMGSILTFCLGMQKTKILQRKSEGVPSASSGRGGGQSCDSGIKGKLCNRSCVLLMITLSVQSGECAESKKTVLKT